MTSFKLPSGYKTNKEAEASTGVWIAEPSWEGMEFCVKRAGGSNHAYSRMAQKLSAPYLRQIQNNTIDPEVMQDLTVTVFCQSVLVDWKGVLDENGHEVTFSPGEAKKLFMEAGDLFDEVSRFATLQSTFAQQRLEEAQADLGNS